MEPSDQPLTTRDRAILAAVAAGTAELGVGGELYLEGLCCCDQAAARRLVLDGLIAGTASTSARTVAHVTPAGHAALAHELATA